MEACTSLSCLICEEANRDAALWKSIWDYKWEHKVRPKLGWSHSQHIKYTQECLTGYWLRTGLSRTQFARHFSTVSIEVLRYMLSYLLGNCYHTHAIDILISIVSYAQTHHRVWSPSDLTLTLSCILPCFRHSHVVKPLNEGLWGRRLTSH